MFNSLTKFTKHFIFTKFEFSGDYFAIQALKGKLVNTAAKMDMDFTSSCTILYTAFILNPVTNFLGRYSSSNKLLS